MEQWLAVIFQRLYIETQTLLKIDIASPRVKRSGGQLKIENKGFFFQALPAETVSHEH